jgi:hypothetical protein
MSSTTFVTTSEAHSLTNEHGVVNRYYFGNRAGDSAGPQGWLIEFPATRTVGIHFHQIDQFQVFFTRPGTTFKRHEMEPLVVHYSDAYSTYGPIVAGKEPIRFMTLRAQGSNFTAYMPDEKDKLIKRGRRNYHVGVGAWLMDPLPSPFEIAIESLFKKQTDGLAALKVSAGPEAIIAGPSPEGSSGQYYCVISGELRHIDQHLEPFTVGWCGPDEEPPTVIAGNEGARLLVLQFPFPPSVENAPARRTKA